MTKHLAFVITALLSSLASQVFAEDEIPKDPNQQLFARSVMYQSLTDFCVAHGQSESLKIAYQQWLLRHQMHIDSGRQSIALLAAEQGRSMESVAKIFLHMVEQNWAKMDEGNRSLKCIGLQNYLEQPVAAMNSEFPAIH